ncbi:MAG: acyltransferase [Nitrosomonas ureae]|jgi:peptidoglycan/LPS O-acetylase OafA/YrhL
MALTALNHSANEHVNYLDGWRGLAIALVLEGHFSGLIPLETGRLGVDVFFCLSGYLMSGILFIQRQPLSRFYKRRVSRILPAFLVFVTVTYTFAFQNGDSFSVSEVISTLLFLRTYFPSEPGIWGTGIPIGHIWSLNIEEHCYIFMSLVVLLSLFRGREGALLLVSGAGCIGIGFLYVKLGTQAPRWGSLGSEVAASHLLVSGGYRLISKQRGFVVPPYAPLLALAAAMICYSKLVPWWSSSLLSPFLLAFSINHLSETYGEVKRLLATPIFRLLGIWSFSIYLWQQPFYAYKESIPGGVIVALAGAMVVAVCSYHVVEQPCRSWLNERWQG